MRSRIIIFAISLTVVLGFAGIAYMQSSKEYSIEIAVKPSKKVYMLGEVVSLDILLQNNGIEDVKIFGGLSKDDGLFSISISKDNRNFKKYSHIKWGRADVKRIPVNLGSGKNTNTLATVFWNNKPSVSNSLAPDVIKQKEVGRILTSYAFPDAGEYYIKASYFLHLTAKPILIESEPIKITIGNPQGENLEVWNRIKDDGNFAYFIQEGEFLIPGYKTEERDKFKQKIEEIINIYPNSFYTQSLSESLTKFNANEAKRQEFLQKLEKQN